MKWQVVELPKALDVKVTKILAVGCNKRFLWLDIGDLKDYCVRISDVVYRSLKSKGVPTAQSMLSKNLR